MGVSYTTYQVYTNALLVADIPNTSYWTQADALGSLQKAQRYVYALYCSADDDYFRTDTYINSSSFLQDGTRQYMNYYPLPSDFYRLRLLQYQNVYGGLSAPFRNADKMTGQNYGNTQNVPAYRMIGQNLPSYNYLVNQTYPSGQYVSGTSAYGGVSTVWQASQTVPSGGAYAPPNASYWTPVAPNVNGYLAIYDPVGYQSWALAYYPQPPAITINVAGTTGTDIGANYPDNLVPEIFVYQMAVDIRIKAKVPADDISGQLQGMLKTLDAAMLKDNNKPEPIKDVFATGFAPWV